MVFTNRSAINAVLLYFALLCSATLCLALLCYDLEFVCCRFVRRMCLVCFCNDVRRAEVFPVGFCNDLKGVEIFVLGACNDLSVASRLGFVFVLS